ncbi:MAG: malonyl-CoA decarboxylase [Rhodobacteraceae bacterium]|nr:malonyl-CoA decarboxylase [Paracoccaceae bacterium]
MSLLADLLTTLSARRAAPFGRTGRSGPMQALCQDLMSSKGDVTGAALARDVLDRFDQLSATDRLAFFDHLARGLDLDVPALAAALAQYDQARDRDSYRRFLAVAEPRRQELIRRMNQLPGATGRLVAMRAALLKMLPDRPDLAALDLDFQHLFASWFNRGFLVLRPINWESPAHVLEKIIAYEAVHAIDSWDDLRRRLKPADRRCFAYFHPAMPDEPLIFVEVALTGAIPGSIQGILAPGRTVLEASDATTAVFYSISNCQAGLAGISFGNSLIKQVVEDLSRELPGLRSFVTLSPIPGLMAWMAETGRAGQERDPARLRELAALYLLEARTPWGKPRDPVARFHLNNGAQVHEIHAEADLSDHGKAQSGGAMVNYLYDRARITQTYEQFLKSNEVPATRELRLLARNAQKAEADQ